MIAKTTAVLNTNHKPWRSGEFKRQREEGLCKFLAAEGENAALWSSLRERMAFDMGTTPDQLPDSMAEAFKGLSTFSSKDDYVRDPSLPRKCVYV